MFLSGIKSIAWSHGWCLGSLFEASSLKTFEYVWDCVGICSIDCLGAIFAASPVDTVVLERMGKLTSFSHL